MRRYYGEVVKIRPMPGSGGRQDITVRFGPSYKQTIGYPCRELVKVDIPIDSDKFYPERFSPGDIVDVSSFHSGNDVEELYRGRVATVDDARRTCDVYYYDGYGYEKNIPTDQRKVRLISPLSDDRSWLDGKEVLVRSPENVHYAATISSAEESRGSRRLAPKFASEGKEAFMSDGQAAEAALSLQMSRSLDERRIRVYTWPLSGTACPAETARKKRRDVVNYNEDLEYSSTAGSDGGDSLSQMRKGRTVGNLSFQSTYEWSEEEDIEAYNDRIAGSGGRSDRDTTAPGNDSSTDDLTGALTSSKRQRLSNAVGNQVTSPMQRGDQTQQSNRTTVERSDADGSDCLTLSKAAASSAAAAGQGNHTDPCIAKTSEQLPSAETSEMTEAGISNSREAQIPRSNRIDMLRKL